MVTRLGPGRPVPSSGPPSPRWGGKGLWGPRRGGGRGCIGVGGVLLCVPCRAVLCDRSEFVTPPPPPRSASPLPLAAPARPRPLHPPRGGAGGGEGLPGSPEPRTAPAGLGKCQEEPGLWSSAGKALPGTRAALEPRSPRGTTVPLPSLEKRVARGRLSSGRSSCSERLNCFQPWLRKDFSGDQFQTDLLITSMF